MAPLIVMAADAAIHGSINYLVLRVEFEVSASLLLGIHTKQAAGSVDGRVRGHDENWYVGLTSFGRHT
jgi:hypothetical protein